MQLKEIAAYLKRIAARAVGRASPLLAEHSEKIFIVIAAAVFTAHARVYWPYTIDDAYITFRYSKNLAEGLGLVFNPGERVEGFTSMLWALWISLGIKLGAGPLVFSKVSGFLLALATIVYVGVRTHGLVSLCLACSGVFTYWAIVGLETPLFVFAVVFALGELQQRKFLRSALMLGAIPWIRPDGQLFTALVFAPFLAFSWYESVKRHPDATAGLFSRRNLLKVAVAIVLPNVALVAFRWFYYQSWQPNTYYSKVAMPSYQGFHEQLRDMGIPYVQNFWSQHVWLGVIAAVSFVFAAWKRRKLQLLTHLALVAYQAYFAFVGGDWMPQFRWYAAVIPLYLMLAYPTFTFLFQSLHRTRYTTARYATVGLALALLMTSFHKQSIKLTVNTGTLRFEEKHQVLFTALGRQLATAVPFDQTILLGDIGMLGYESNLRVIDGIGLTDKSVSRIQTIHFWKSDVNYYFSQNPEWVLLRLYYHYLPAPEKVQAFEQAIADQPEKRSFTPDLWQSVWSMGRWHFERQLLQSPEFHARYGTVFVTPEFDQPQVMALFCRQDICETEAAKRLMQWAPNLGHIKQKLGRADADYYLQRTSEIVPHEEASTVALAKKHGNREVLRKIASDSLAPTANRVEAYTALGLEEYEWKEYNAAYHDFKAAVEAGGTATFNYSNVGWALKALGNEPEAQRWFSKGK